MTDTPTPQPDLSDEGLRKLAEAMFDMDMDESAQALLEVRDQTRAAERALMAKALYRAWKRYETFFGESPHGTEKQMAALLELVPSELRRAAEKGDK